MTRYYFDLYPRASPFGGALVERLEPAPGGLQRAEYRGEANGAGVGLLVTNGDGAYGQLIDPLGLQYVRVVADDTDEVVGGWFLDAGDFDLISKRVSRALMFSGAGALSYLEREVMWTHSYETWGHDPAEGGVDTWKLHNQSGLYGGDFLGAVLWRVIHEGLGYVNAPGYKARAALDDDKLESAIPELVLTFSGTLDTDGNPWTLPSGEFTASVGETLYAVTQRLMRAGLYVELDPDTAELRAWEAAGHRRDRTGGAFGADVVRFVAGVNIKSDAKRAVTAHVTATSVLAYGQNVGGMAAQAGTAKWHRGVYSDAANVPALEQLAASELSRRTDAGDTMRFPFVLGDTPLTGAYRPFEEVRLDDIVTVDTGAGQWDHDEASFPVAALTVRLRDQGEWDAEVELGATYQSMADRAFHAAGVPHVSQRPLPRPCAPIIPSDLALGEALGGACSASGTNHLSDHPAWSGDREERVEITLSDAVDVGETLVAVCGWNATPQRTTVVYDEQGNAWTMDAFYEQTASSGDNRIEYWRCNVTNALAAGDYVRFAANLGASLLSGVEFGIGERCIGVLRWPFPLHTPVAGVGEGAFGSVVDIATPAGDVVLAGVENWSGTTNYTADPDWNAAYNLTMAGIRLFVQQRIDAPASTWTPVPTAGGDHAEQSVAYQATAGAVAGDGHADLIGTPSLAYANCDHRHDVHRDTAPTVNDDGAAGYKLGTIWAQLDDLGTPTEIEAVWMLVDDATGAAVWLPWPDATGAAGTFDGVRATRTTAQTITTGTHTAVSLDAEDFDTAAYHNLVTNPSRITIPAGAGGTYEAFAQLGHVFNATGQRAAIIWLNGVGTGTRLCEGSANALSVIATRFSISTGPIALAAGDFLELGAWHNRGANNDVEAGARLSLKRLS